MKRSNRLFNVTSKQNAWCGVVRGSSLSIDSGFCAPSLGLGYQPEHSQPTRTPGGQDDIRP